MEGGNKAMNTIDQRIVEMRFDNKQFEGGIQTSLKSLDNLKKGLNLDESAKSLSNLDRVGRSFSLASIAEGVDNISKKFTALGIIGMTVLANITNSALNTGRRMISALTIDPIRTGLNEYETKINAIQTILTNTASKGTKIEDVTKTLNELNEYSDKTIYNFAEMARNIGTFTAAGVGLKESAIAIKGIANLAAGSGSTSEQASTVMYQLSQALASGTVKLQDWNSVVNGGMGGELFQKALEKTAKELGNGRNMAVSFRESLEDGWLTTAVLTKTLEKFASDESLIKAATQVKTFTQLIDTMKESVQSGWAQSWEQIIGNKEQAAALFTSINDAFGAMIGTSIQARNEMLSFWNVNGGRDAIIQALVNSFKGLQSILSPIGEAFRSIFPPMTGEKLVEISNKIKALTENFKIGETTANNIKRTFAGLFAVLDIGKMALSAFAKGIASVVGYLLPAGDGFLAITGSIGDFIVYIDKALKSSDAFNVGIAKIGNLLKPIADGIKNAIILIIESFKSLGSVDTSGLDSFSERVKARFEPFTALGNMVKNVFDGIAKTLKKFAPVIYKLASLVGKAFGKLQENIVTALDNAEFKSIFDLVNGGLFAGILYGLKKFIDSLTNITDGSGGLLGNITGILDGVKGSLEAYQSALKANTLLKIAVAIGILAASLLTLSLIDSEKLTSALMAMTAMFIDLFGSMAIFSKIMDGPGLGAMAKLSIGMIGLSTAILILSNAMTKLSKLDWNGIAKGLIAIAGLSGILIASSKLLEKNSASLIRASLGFILFGAAMNILASAVEKLAKIDVKGLAKGLVGVGVLAAELSLFMKMTNLSGMGVTKGVGFIALAVAISLLADSVKKFSEINSSSLIKGLGGIGILLLELSLFANSTGNSKRIISTAAGLTILGVSMLIFGEAIKNMGAMSWESISKGLTTMAGALVIITATMNKMPNNMVLTGAGLVIVAGSLLILSQALSTMGGMTWEQIAKGLVTLAGSLTIIGVALSFMTGTLAGSAALLVAATALRILAPVLQALGAMSLTEIGKGLLALAGVFTVMGIAGLLLAPLTPVILTLSLAMAVFGAGCIAVGVGVLAFAAGLSALAIAGTAASGALVVAITAIIGLIPMTLVALAKGLIDFVVTIGNGIPLIIDAMVKILTAIIDTIILLTPKIVTCLLLLINTLLQALVVAVPQMVDSGMKLILGLLNGITANIQKVVAAGINVIVQFLNGVAQKLPAIIEAAFRVIISFINGLADAIRNNHNAIYDAVGNLVSSIIEAIGDLGYKFVEAGANAVKGFLKGLASMGASLWEAGSNLGKSALSAAKKALDSHSPSREFAKLGSFSGEGFVIGLDSYGSKVAKSATNVGTTAVESLGNAISNISDVISGEVDMNPTIRPVLDLSNVQNGSKQLYNMMNKHDGYTMDSSINMANNASNGMLYNKNLANNTSSTNSNVTGPTPVSSQNNTFHITGSNPKEIADEVSRILQKQVERRDAVWA